MLCWFTNVISVEITIVEISRQCHLSELSAKIGYNESYYKDKGPMKSHFSYIFLLFYVYYMFTQHVFIIINPIPTFKGELIQLCKMAQMAS